MKIKWWFFSIFISALVVVVTVFTDKTSNVKRKHQISDINTNKFPKKTYHLITENTNYTKLKNLGGNNQ